MEVFFYGLFMDITLLKKNGLAPANPRKGHLNDYTLRIGKRASLLPAKGEKAYGLLMSVDEEATLNLYAEPSVAEEVEITLDSGERVKATCYNLPPALITGTNTAYAQSLYELGQKLGLPLCYLNQIKKMVGPI